MAKATSPRRGGHERCEGLWSLIKEGEGNMRRARVVMAMATMLGVGLMGATPAAADGTEVLDAALTGAAEVPGPGDPDGAGTARVLLLEHKNQVCFTLRVSGIVLPAAAAHIHVGAVDMDGDVVVTLLPPDEHGRSTGCVAADAGLIAEIAARPHDYYVNVHTGEYPTGAVRGQLHHVHHQGHHHGDHH